jgi:hypothetical protein
MTKPGNPSHLLQEAQPGAAEILLLRSRAVKHFHHTLETHHFTIFTNHKPITYAFKQKREK